LNAGADLGGGSNFAGLADLDASGTPDVVLGGAATEARDNGVAVLWDNLRVVSAPRPGAVRGWSLAITPNPAAERALLSWAMPAAGPVSLRVYDVTGRRVATPWNGLAAAGEHTAHWELRSSGGSRVGPGVYFAELRCGGASITQRIAVTN
jgi:hypothetical protein